MPDAEDPSWLGVEEMRRILGYHDLTDEQIRILREDLYAWLNRALDEYFASTGAVYSEGLPP